LLAEPLTLSVELGEDVPIPTRPVAGFRMRFPYELPLLEML
jgi:hypothetical protein